MSDIRCCAICGAVQAYARPVCSACHGRQFVLRALPMVGEIYSLTTVQRAPSPAFAPPYIVALVRGPSGGLLMMQARDFASPPSIGDKVSIEAGDGAMVARPIPTEGYRPC
jgi:uncharacterized OB-fold protein